MTTNTVPSGATVAAAAEKFKQAISAKAEVVEEAPPEPTPEPEAVLEETPPEVRTFKVKVDGEELELPEDEILKGYSRTADYTKKTQKLSEERKALEVESQAVKQERERYAEGLKILESQLSTVENVDWQKLREDDPLGYAIRKQEQRDRQDQLALVKAEQQKIVQLQQDEQRRALEKYVQDEQAKLAKAIPEWKDAKIATAEQEKLKSYLLSLDYSEAEIAQIYDHRAVVTVRKAALYDEMMSKAKTQSEKAAAEPKTAPPGNLKQQNRQYQDAKSQFQTSRSLKDAAALTKLLLRK